MAQQFQVLKVKNLSHLNPLMALVHDPKENVSLVEWGHQELQILSLDFFYLLIWREQILWLDLGHKFSEAV